MPSTSHPRNEEAKFQLSQSQELILAALDGQEGLGLRKLILAMARRPLTPAEELVYARRAKAHCDWLEIHQLVTTQQREGHLIYTKAMLLRPVKQGWHYRPAYSSARSLVLASAVALALSACSHNPFNSAEASDKPMRAYSASSLPLLTERIAQFSDTNGESIYRYCRDDECPGPTPKVLYRVTERTTRQLGTPPGRPQVTDEKSLKEALKELSQAAAKVEPAKVPTGSPSARVVSSEPSLALKKSPQASEGSALVRPAHTKGTEAAGASVTPDDSSRASSNGTTQKQSAAKAIAEMPLRADSSFGSYDALISFANGGEILNGESKEMIAKLANQARDAEVIRLRGHVASRSLTEEQTRLAIGRSIAVRHEFMRQGIERQKIRIMNPRENDLVDSTNVNSISNRSVEISFGKPKTPVA